MVAFNLLIYLTLSIFNFVHVHCTADYKKDLSPASKTYLGRAKADVDEELALAQTLQEHPCLSSPQTFTSTHLNSKANPNCPDILRIRKCPKHDQTVIPAHGRSLNLVPPLNVYLDGGNYSFYRISKLTWKSHPHHQHQRNDQCCESSSTKTNRNVYHHPEGSLRQKITVKEVHTNSSSSTSLCTCIVLIGQRSNSTARRVDEEADGHQSNYRSRNIDEKRVIKSVKEEEEVTIYLDYDVSIVHLSEREELHKIRSCLQAFCRSNNNDVFENDLEERERYRRQTISNSMIFPTYRYLQERKRSGLKWTEKDDDNPSQSKIFPKGDDGSVWVGSGKGRSRAKREIHVMMARYRKATITKRNSSKKRPKSHSDCNEEDDKVSTTPYTFLNVSFTGYSERVETTTVKPRVEKPLKMTPEDLEWVYNQPKTKKPKTKTKFKAVIKGPSSHFKFHVKSS